MKKIVIALGLSVSILLSHVQVFADTYIDQNKAVEAGYSCLYLEGQYFLVPSYYPESVYTDDKTGVILRDSDNDVIMIYNYFILDDDQNKQLSSKDGLTSFLKNVALSEDEVSNVDVVESITVRGRQCALTTCYSDDKLHILKESAIYDPSEKVLYMLILWYAPSLDGTKYTNDFYKILNTDPDTVSYQTQLRNANTQSAAPAQQPPAQSQSNEGYDDFSQYLRDTADFYDDYSNALDRIGNAQTTGDMIGGLMDAYGSLYDYLGDYY